jgi:hypothetical protein
MGFYNLHFSRNYDDKIKRNDMRRACGTHECKRKYIQYLNRKRKEETTWKALSKWNIIKMFLKEQIVIGIIWFGI